MLAAVTGMIQIKYLEQYLEARLSGPHLIISVLRKQKNCPKFKAGRSI